MPTPNFKKLKNALWALLAIWLLGVGLASYVGVFDGRSRYSMSVPIPLGMAAVLPVVFFGVAYRVSGTFREYVLSINPVVLTAVQSWRVGGIVFLILMMRGILAPAFALPAGLGDITIGVTAPFVATAMSRKNLSANGFARWQLAGIADLVVAVTMGVLSSPSSIGILAHGATTEVMGLLPLSLIPTFAVPLLVIFHLICVEQARSGRLGKIGMHPALSNA